MTAEFETDHPRESSGRFAAKTGTAPTVMLSAPMPTVEKSGLSHVGTLNTADKKAFSYEGQGLSVSQHPDDWSRIARLTGPTHALHRTGTFLDYHELSEEQTSLIVDYAVSKGWVEEATVYRVRYYDDEWEQEMEMTLTSREEAEDEADGKEGEVLEETSFIYLEMPDTTCVAGKPADLGVVTAAWVNEERPDLDGTWWDDDYDVSRLSAPRGVISPRRISDWLPTQ